MRELKRSRMNERELKRSRMNENDSDVRYYDGYTKFTVPMRELKHSRKVESRDSKIRETVKKDSKPFKKESKKHFICESTLSDMDGDVRQWAVDHIIDRLDEMEGMEVELSDLAHELVDRENIDGGVFYNNQQAWEWVSNHRYDAGDVLAMMCEEWGTCSPNPLIDPDAFCVVFLEEAIAEVLYDSATVQDGGKVELTREVIDAIVEEIQ